MKKCLLLETNTISKFLVLKWNIIDAGFLFDYWHILLFYYLNKWMNLEVYAWMNEFIREWTDIS